MVVFRGCFNLLSGFCDRNHKHTTRNPTIVGKQLTFPTAEEAAHPVLLCKHVVVFTGTVCDFSWRTTTLNFGGGNPKDLQHCALMDHRDLAQRQKMRPLESEFRAYRQVFESTCFGTEAKQVFLLQPNATEWFIDS